MRLLQYLVSENYESKCFWNVFFGSEKFVVLKIFLTFDTVKYLLYKRGSWELKI